MNIIVAKSAGYCFGVRDAVNMAYETAEKYGNVYMLGDIVHNEKVVADLEKAGAKVVQNLDQVPKDTTFCLVHLDTDRYKSTLEGLEYFYNRLVSGGRIVIHDYNCIGTPGVKLAVDEFLKKLNLSHLLISLSESQAMLIKN